MQAYQPSAAQSLSLCPAVYITGASVATARGIRSAQGIPGDLSLGGRAVQMSHISTRATHSGSWAATSRPPVMEDSRRFRIRLGGLGRFLRRLQEPSSRFDRCAGQAQEACTFVGWRQTPIKWFVSQWRTQVYSACIIQTRRKHLGV